MLKALSDKIYEFHYNGERVRTKIGFNELPDWAAKDPFFKLAQLDGMKVFEGKSAEQVLKEKEMSDSLKSEIAELEAKKKEMEEKLGEVKAKGDDKVAALKAEIAELEAARDSLKDEMEKQQGNRQNNNNRNNNRNR